MTGEIPPSGISPTDFAIGTPWPRECAARIPARTLAYIGDSVFELGMRLFHLKEGTDEAGHLHDSVVGFVCAKNQARAFEQLFGEVSEPERELLRSWRNVKLPYRSMSVSRGVYARSTAFEAWIGFLFLTGDQSRIREMFTLAREMRSSNET